MAPHEDVASEGHIASPHQSLSTPQTIWGMEIVNRRLQGRWVRPWNGCHARPRPPTQELWAETPRKTQGGNWARVGRGLFAQQVATLFSPLLSHGTCGLLTVADGGGHVSVVPTCHEAWAVQLQPREARPASAGVQVGRGGSEDPLEARGFLGTRGRAGSSHPALRPPFSHHSARHPSPR